MKRQFTLQELVESEYQAKRLSVTPRYPRVLVRVIPKEISSYHGIILPGKQENKPIYEGQVVRIYEPRKIEGTVVSCSVKRGDHVLFQHYEGEPIPRLDPLGWRSGEWRLLREDCLLATLTTGEDHWKLLETFLTESCSIKTDSAIKIIENLRSAGDVVMWTEAKTLSGA